MQPKQRKKEEARHSSASDVIAARPRPAAQAAQHVVAVTMNLASGEKWGDTGVRAGSGENVNVETPPGAATRHAITRRDPQREESRSSRLNVDYMYSDTHSTLTSTCSRIDPNRHVPTLCTADGDVHAHSIQLVHNHHDARPRDTKSNGAQSTTSFCTPHQPATRACGRPPAHNF